MLIAKIKQAKWQVKLPDNFILFGYLNLLETPINDKCDLIDVLYNENPITRFSIRTEHQPNNIQNFMLNDTLIES